MAAPECRRWCQRHGLLFTRLAGAMWQNATTLPRIPTTGSCRGRAFRFSTSSIVLTMTSRLCKVTPRSVLRADHTLFGTTINRRDSLYEAFLLPHSHHVEQASKSRLRPHYVQR
jgi:hypothetical protein